ncbi:response regulator [Glaciecola sp. XM2]|jgi:CheY-like chemotaxis protein|uniref:response regulator n=1 Tax=Glaciecola sp. XM2 TaxID=1914931 RepID=UPI001BDF3036|nr:response regulator [Glaciecola sp. XM2]MBT1452196.1 response regulator [Glaciecola sp. XM2]
MSLPVLICDDSSFARKAMARSLPDGWDVDISYASNGQEAIEQIKAGRGDIMFLDLNMPVMDGYETMEAIRAQDLPSMVIVVSGDVQQEARSRMLAMGAIDFIRKPIDNAKLMSILSKYGIYTGEASASKRLKDTSISMGSSIDDKLDAFREVANVAMGQAGENLAKILNSFIDLPIPNVSIVHSNEMSMMLTNIDSQQSVSAVSKGFVSPSIKGEALIIFNDANISAVQRLIGNNKKSSDAAEIEALMDVSNIIIGACLNALSQQLKLNFTHNTPILLGIHCDLDDIVNNNIARWEKVLVIEIAYSVASENINFELLLVIPDRDIDAAFSRLILSQQQTEATLSISQAGAN